MLNLIKQGFQDESPLASAGGFSPTKRIFKNFTDKIFNKSEIVLFNTTPEENEEEV